MTDEGQATNSAESILSTRAVTKDACVVHYEDPAQVPMHMGPSILHMPLGDLVAAGAGFGWVRHRQVAQTGPGIQAEKLPVLQGGSGRLFKAVG